MSPVTGLILLTVSVALFALLNSMEIALVGSSKVRARYLAEQGSTMASALVKLQREQDRFFSATVLLQNLLVFGSAFASEGLASGLTDSGVVKYAFIIGG